MALVRILKGPVNGSAVGLALAVSFDYQPVAGQTATVRPSAFESLVADLLRAVGFRPGDGGGVGHQPAGRGRADYWGQASRRPALMRRRKGFVRAGTSAGPSSERDAHSRETAPTSRHLLVEAQSPLPGTPRASSRKP